MTHDVIIQYRIENRERRWAIGSPQNAKKMFKRSRRYIIRRKMNFGAEMYQLWNPFRLTLAAAGYPIPGIYIYRWLLYEAVMLCTIHNLLMEGK